MGNMLSVYQGCMLGMAVGDAMGAGVDNKTLEDIRTDYGPDGLLGYDLANGFAEISSYTQVAAFAVNGLLVGMAHGYLKGPFLPHISMALKEWASSQHFPRETERKHCWLCHEQQMRRRRAMDPRTLDALTRDVLGTPQRPANSADGPGTLPAAVAAGLLFLPERMQPGEVGSLGAETVALTHGAPVAFLSGAVLAYVIAGVIHDRESTLDSQFINAVDAVAAQFASYPEAAELQRKVKRAVTVAKNGQRKPDEVMEKLGCTRADDVLCGAMYAALVAEGDFDRAMIVAINHSGKSAAVGAVCGAILGARLGMEALPSFYVDCLDAGSVLKELAADLFGCGSGKVTRRLFDDVWDRKYIQGLPVGTGWAEV